MERIKEDPELSWLLEKPALNIWLARKYELYLKVPTDCSVRIGDGRHVMTYTIGAGKTFNMVLSHPDDSEPSTWDQATVLSDMKREFQGWDCRYGSPVLLLVKSILFLLTSAQARESRWTHRKNRQMATYEWSPLVPLGRWTGIDLRRCSACNVAIHVTR